MRKFLAPIAVAAILCANLALCESKMAEAMIKTKEINEGYVEFYEFTISREDLTDETKTAYRNSLRTFMINASEENLRNDPDLYEGLQED
jgi:hypothetical protein